MLAPHERQTYQRIATRSEALAVHDTTELEFGGEREGLGPLSRGTRRGFFMPVTLAVAADASRQALGVVHPRFWGRPRHPPPQPHYPPPPAPAPSPTPQPQSL